MIDLLVVLDSPARNSVMSFRLVQSNLKATMHWMFLLELSKKKKIIESEEKKKS